MQDPAYIVHMGVWSPDGFSSELERNANPGDVTDWRALYVITDPAQTTVVFNIFPRNRAIIRPGMRVTVETQDRAESATAPLEQFLPDGNVEAGTAHIRATIPNRPGKIGRA